MPIICVERVLVAVTDIHEACGHWRSAGFAVAGQPSPWVKDGFALVRAGAIDIQLIHVGAQDRGPSARAIARGGGVIGWVWGVTETGVEEPESLTEFLPGVWIAQRTVEADPTQRHVSGPRLYSGNENTVEYLEHVVVMTPSLEDAIAAHEKLGLQCKRIREAGGGMRQAFFKLEQTVLEIVGPAKGEPHVWGLAFMCTDIEQAVHTARANGLQATDPKAAVQGGRIARIVEPLDGVAIAFMERAAGA